MAIERYYEKKLEDGGVEVVYSSKEDVVTIWVHQPYVTHMRLKPNEVDRLIALLQEVTKPEKEE